MWNESLTQIKLTRAESYKERKRHELNGVNILVLLLFLWFRVVIVIALINFLHAIYISVHDLIFAIRAHHSSNDL